MTLDKGYNCGINMTINVGIAARFRSFCKRHFYGSISKLPMYMGSFVENLNSCFEISRTINPPIFVEHDNSAYLCTEVAKYRKAFNLHKLLSILKL